MAFPKLATPGNLVVFFFRTLLLLESFTVTFKEFASCFVASGFQETGVCL